MQYHGFPITEIMRMADRKWIFDYIPKNKIWAELGVFRGSFSDMIYHYAKPKKMYLVDPWTKLGEGFNFNSPYDDFGKLTTEFAKNEVFEKIKSYTNCRCIVLEEYSTAFCNRVKEKIDVIYLDSSHNYEMTLKELPAISAILADDGIICGDDWHWYPKNKYHGVFRAIHEFIKKNDFQIIAAGPGKQWLMHRSPIY